MSTKYNFKIKTADQFLAGTDANIFVKMFGAKGISAEVRLNGHISGNAFERNALDECSIDFDEDCGDIYMIQVRSDMMWAGAGWLCNYFSVQREDGPVVMFQFTSAQWIEDEDVRNLYATSGYDYDLPEHKIEWTIFYGTEHHVPANIVMEIDVKEKVEFTIEMSEVEVLENQGKESVKVSVDVIKAAFENQIKESLQKHIGGKLNQSEEISHKIQIPASETAKTYQEVWRLENFQFSAQLGSMTYNFSIPNRKVFAGFKEVDNVWPDDFNVL